MSVSLELVQQLEGVGALTRTGLRLHGDISKERMYALGQLIGEMHTAFQFAAGDFLVECDQRFGHEADQLMEALGISLESQKQYWRVAKGIPEEMRVEGISWSHHRAVCHLSADEITFYLKEAKEKQWPKRVLEQEIKKDLAPRPTKELPAPAEATPAPSVMMDWDTDAGEVQRITLRYASGKQQPFIPEDK
jgi:hypothetical protein